MRKKICIILALVMLIGVLGCCMYINKNRKDVKDSAVSVNGTDEESRTGPAKKNTDEEIEALAKDFGGMYLNGGYDPEKHKDAFIYAKPCTMNDWHRLSPDINQWLYTDVPYNIFVTDIGDNPSRFATNKELVAELGEEAVAYYADMASSFCATIATNSHGDMNVETMTRQFLDCGIPQEKAAIYAKEKVDYYNSHEFTRDSWIIWNESSTDRSRA